MKLNNRFHYILSVLNGGTFSSKVGDRLSQPLPRILFAIVPGLFRKWLSEVCGWLLPYFKSRDFPCPQSLSQWGCQPGRVNIRAYCLRLLCFPCSPQMLPDEPFLAAHLDQRESQQVLENVCNMFAPQRNTDLGKLDQKHLCILVLLKEPSHVLQEADIGIKPMDQETGFFILTLF